MVVWCLWLGCDETMVIEHKVISGVKTERSMMHSIEDHNYWIKRNKRCPYCQNGSQPVAKAMIIKEVNKR